MNLSEFLADEKLRNAWIDELNMKVYVRRSMRMIGDEVYKCLDIGSVEVDEDKTGKGIFTKFLARFEQEAKKIGRVIFIESILNPRLYQYLLKNGYKTAPRSSDISPNVYKIIN